MNGTIVSGTETVMARSGLYEALASADWVITGEGCFDRQSLRGKVVSGILKAALQSNVRVAVIAGQVKLPLQEYRKLGIAAAVACQTEGLSLQYALENSRMLLVRAAQQLATEHILR
jgi:glycerate kinase